MAKLDFNLKLTALLVMDCKVGIVNSLTSADKDRVLKNVFRVLEAARKAGIPVIYVCVQFRDGYPEVSPRNTLFSGVKVAGRLRQTQPDAKICDELRPRSDEPVVTKKRISAFTGSDLEVILRSKGIDTLVLTGVSSLGVIESTARFAFDMDYRIFVLGDCCADRDPESNQLALTRFLPRISTVSSTDDFVASI